MEANSLCINWLGPVLVAVWKGQEKRSFHETQKNTQKIKKEEENSISPLVLRVYKTVLCSCE